MSPHPSHRSRTTGRPVGAEEWIKALEAAADRKLAPAKRGPKPTPGPDKQQGELFCTVSP